MTLKNQSLPDLSLSDQYKPLPVIPGPNGSQKQRRTPDGTRNKKEQSQSLTPASQVQPPLAGGFGREFGLSRLSRWERLRHVLIGSVVLPLQSEIVEVMAQIRACAIARILVFACEHACGIVRDPDLHTIQDRAAKGEQPVHVQEVGGFARDLHDVLIA